MEIDGTLDHLQWTEDGLVSMPHFTDTVCCGSTIRLDNRTFLLAEYFKVSLFFCPPQDGPFPRHASSSSAPPHRLRCPETTQAPGHLAGKTDQHQQRQQRFPEKMEAEKDADHSRSHHQDRRGSPGDSTTSSSTATTVWSSVELDTGFTPSHRGGILTVLSVIMNGTFQLWIIIIIIEMLWQEEQDRVVVARAGRYGAIM